MNYSGLDGQWVAIKAVLRGNFRLIVYSQYVSVSFERILHNVTVHAVAHVLRIVLRTFSDLNYKQRIHQTIIVTSETNKIALCAYCKFIVIFLIF